MGRLLDEWRKNTGTAAPTLNEDSFAPDLIPDVTPDTRSEEDVKIDQLMSRVGIVDAYRRWCGKMEPVVGNKTESIMVSCPWPGHPDSNPSAWLNSEKDVGHCALCGGFDRYDLAAWFFGFPVPDYKTNGQFPDLRKRIAMALGLTVTKTPAGNEVIQEPPAERKLALVPTPPAEDDEEPVGQVVQPIDPEEDDDVAYMVTPPPHTLPSVPLLWEECILPDSTFLRTWMDLCRVDDLPEEYYFFLGLMAIAAALGNEGLLLDREPVRGNLMVCLVGPSGLGKSRSTRALKTLLDEAFPFDKVTGGCRWIANVGSAEALVDEFNVEEMDPVTGNTIKIPVRGILRFDELSTLSQKANRQGSTIKQMVMEMYDSPAEIHTRSRTAGQAKARDHFFQMVSSTQPDVMSTLLTDQDAVSGFLNRWVFVNGTQKTLIPWGGTPIDIEDALPAIKDVRIFGGMTPHIILEKNAEERFAQFFYEELVPLKLNPETPLFARADLLMKKLMLLMAGDCCKSYVSLENVEACIKIWNWLKGTFAFVQDEASVKAEVKERNQVEDDILRVSKFHYDQTGLNPTMRDIQRRLGHKWKKYGVESVMRAVKMLCVSGQLLEYTMPNARNRQVTRYKVN